MGEPIVVLRHWKDGDREGDRLYMWCLAGQHVSLPPLPDYIAAEGSNATGKRRAAPSTTEEGSDGA